MFLFRLVTLAVVGASVLSPLSAQGIPRGSRNASSVVNSAPRFMVANPFAFAPADSAPAVKIGTALREGMKDKVTKALPRARMEAHPTFRKWTGRKFVKEEYARSLVAQTLHESRQPDK